MVQEHDKTFWTFLDYYSFYYFFLRWYIIKHYLDIVSFNKTVQKHDSQHELFLDFLTAVIPVIKPNLVFFLLIKQFWNMIVPITPHLDVFSFKETVGLQKQKHDSCSKTLFGLFSIMRTAQKHNTCNKILFGFFASRKLF